MLATLAVLAFLAVIGTACSAAGGGGKASSKLREDLTIDEAFSQLQRMIRDTAKSAAPNLSVNIREEAEIANRACEDGDDPAHVFSTWDLEVLMDNGREPTALLPAVEDHWKDRGYEIDRHVLDDPHPELIARDRGFVVRAVAVPGSGVLALVGDTPCVPNPDLAGDGQKSTRARPTYDEALARLTPLVQAAAKAAAPDLGPPAEPEVTLGRCAEPAEGFPILTVNVPVPAGREPAELLPAVEEHWTAQGYDIDRQEKAGGQRDLFAKLGDYDLRAVAVPGSGKLSLIGRGPCVPKPGGAQPGASIP